MSDVGAVVARLRLGAGAIVVFVLLARLGSGPFTDGLTLSSRPSLLAATVLTGVTTACCAWRWRLVSGALGVPLRPAAAIAAVYRAQFLNATLPGGVLGDVDRAAEHARTSRQTGAGLRSVVWERTLGQVVQVAMTLALLAWAPPPVRAVGVRAGAVGALVLLVALTAGLAARRSRIVGVTRRDLRRILGDPRATLGGGLLSAAALAGHLAVFLLAAHVAGVRAPMTTLLPVAAVVLLAAAVPVNVAGWGPREGVAAWAFGSVGLGAGLGLTTSVVYGVMALVATLPGAAVLAAGRRAASRRRMRAQPEILLGQAAHA